jgi:hypothetical protein
VICKHKRVEIDCEYCFMSVTWAIVKDARGMRDTGHDAAVRWARAYLGLEDRDRVVGSRTTHEADDRVTE